MKVSKILPLQKIKRLLLVKMSHCGHFLINNRDSPLPALSAPLPAKTNAVLLGTPCTHTLYSAYVGNVDLDCATHAKNRVFLQSTVTDQSTGQSIDVRVINAREHKLSDSVTYSTEYLKQLHPMIIDKDEILLPRRATFLKPSCRPSK